MKIVSATPVTAGCRMIKSAHEVELMRLASTVTLKAYAAAFRALQDGMTQDQFAALVASAHSRLGFTGGAGAQVGVYSALPHGSMTPQVIKEGTIILIDGGCSVEGYSSDLSRTFVLGKATDKMKQVFDIVHRAQKTALDTARPGIPLDAIDAAARRVITEAGYGPGFTLLHPSGGPRPGDGRARMAVSREEQHVRVDNVARRPAGHDLQRRAGHLHPRRVRRAPRGRHADHREGCRAAHAAEPIY